MNINKIYDDSDGDKIVVVYGKDQRGHNVWFIDWFEAEEITVEEVQSC